ncbi:hypothetical protein [Dokdonella sp.]|uniref:hypothetical protein n=1 Tax=Dokdonella sp. TaxID=2291710 RepID=UPI001B25A0AB|nr:hypothetical protein [Dokdonella sp.]MBO9661642.1 hypothetical protein [Dokdonella sp.]
MFRIAAILLTVSFASAVSAQVQYGGYDLGPDYGAMIRQVQQQQQAMNAQMQQRTQTLVAQAMQDPQCQAMYRQHLANGGRLSFPDFAYQYLATGHFSAPGIARYRQTEGDNQRRERAAYAGVREAERNLSNAIADGNAHFSDNQASFRQVLGGERTWVDPGNGNRVSLPYVGDAAPYTDQNGYVYQRDVDGRYFVRDPNGDVYEMTPEQ